MLLRVSGNCVSDALNRLKTSFFFLSPFNSAQGGAGELCLQRRPEPPPAVLLQRPSGGSGRSGRGGQIRSAQPEAPGASRHPHPAPAEGEHLRLWVRLRRSAAAIITRCYLCLKCVPLSTRNTRYVLDEKYPLPPSVLARQPLAHGG